MTWQEVIDKLRGPWEEDEGVDLPTAETIERAVALAEILRDSKKSPPDSVVADPNGGFVIDIPVAEFTDSYHVWDDGEISLIKFLGHKVVSRRVVELT